VNNYSRISDAKVACKLEANSRAKFGSPEWPWLAFSTYLSGDTYVKTGNIILIEPNAQFENAFGGKPHVKVRCSYDLNSGKVDSVLIDQP
jgi:hypothetical protein